MPPAAVLVQVRSEVIERSIPTDVAVKLAIESVAGVTDLSRPDLLACFDIAGKNGRAIRTNDRSVDAKPRPRIAIKDRVSVADEILDSRTF